MEFSKRLNDEAKKFGVPARNLVMGYLSACGFSDAEAYNIAYADSTMNAEYATRNRETILSGTRYQSMVDALKMRFGGTSVSTGGSTKQLSKDEIASILVAQMKALPDGKEKADVAMRYADLYQYKKEETEGVEEDIIRVYIPLTCSICPYYEKSKEGKK